MFKTPIKVKKPAQSAPSAPAKSMIHRIKIKFTAIPMKYSGTN